MPRTARSAAKTREADRRGELGERQQANRDVAVRRAPPLLLPASIILCAAHTIFELNDNLLADECLEEGVEELRAGKTANGREKKMVQRRNR